MRAVVLTSTAPRHMYFLQTMSRAFDVVLALHQPKQGYYESARQNSVAIREHFYRLKQAEDQEFGSRLSSQDIQAQMRVVEDINAESLIEEVRQARVEVALLFGTVILSEAWLNALPDRIINLHLGLSPFYRGAATLFWPFVSGELECVGTTIHLATQRVDAGAILHRVKADPQVGDSYYTMTTRLIRNSIETVPSVVPAYLSGAIRPVSQGADHARAYRMRDFDETALAKALAFVGDGVTPEQIAEAAKSPKCACWP